MTAVLSNLETSGNVHWGSDDLSGLDVLLVEEDHELYSTFTKI